MADAYDVMQMAKKYGAASRNLEAWDKYMDELQTFKKKQAKGSFFGGLASLGIGALMPALIPAAGGSILDMGMKALGRGSITNALSTLADKAFGVQSIAPKFKGGDTSAHGRAGRKAMKRKAKSIQQEIQSSLDAGKRGKAFTTILQAIMPEIKGVKGDRTLKEFGEEFLGGDIPFFSEEQDKSISDFFKKIGGKAKDVIAKEPVDELYVQMIKDYFDPSIANTPFTETGGVNLQETIPKEAIAMQVTPSRISPDFGTEWYPEGGTQPTSYLESIIKGATSPRQFSVSPYGRYSQSPYGKGMPSLTMLEQLLGGR